MEIDILRGLLERYIKTARNPKNTFPLSPFKDPDFNLYHLSFPNHE